MSLYHIEMKKKKDIDGVEYTASIAKDVVIDFSAASYTVEKEDIGYVLVPDHTKFLKDLYQIFPPMEYNVKIVQPDLSRRTWRNPYVTIALDIRSYENSEKGRIFLPENAVLSDQDYDYLRDVLNRQIPGFGIPGFGLITKEEYIKDMIKNYMSDIHNNETTELFSDKAWDIFCDLIADRFAEVKTKGYVDFDCDLLKDLECDVMDDVMEKMLHSRDRYEKEEERGH